MYNCKHRGYTYTYSEYSFLRLSDLSAAQIQPDVEETDLGEEVVQQREERQEEEEPAPSPVEQVEVEHTYELESKQDEPEDEQDEPEDAPEIIPVEPEEPPEEPVEEEEIAEEPSAVQEHEPEQEEMQEEYPPADEIETHREEEEEPEPEPEPEKREPEPEKTEPAGKRHMQPQGEVRKDKKGPEQVDFRNVLRKTENPATRIASSTFYKSGTSKDAASEVKQVHERERLWYREGGVLSVDVWFEGNLIGV